MYKKNKKLYQEINFIYKNYAFCTLYEVTERGNAIIEINLTENQLDTFINNLIKLRDINEKL